MTDPRPGGLTCAEAMELAPAYVLGALEPAELATVRAHLQECPEAHPAFAELGSVVPALARSVPITAPAPDLGARIMAAARAEAARAASVAALGRPALGDASHLTEAVPRRGPNGDARPEPERRPFAIVQLLRAPRWAAVAAVLVVTVLGVWGLQLQGTVAGLTAYRDGVTAVVDAAAAPGARLAVLRAAGGPSGLAAVSSSGLTLVVRDLAPTSGRQVYEAWLIGSDGQPLPAGSFGVGGDGIGRLVARMPVEEAGVVVALTREPGPGATTPSLPVLIQGKATGA